MHNGSEPYEGVLEAVKELKRAGKKMIILSNSSKRKENSHKMLKKRKYSSLLLWPSCLCCLLTWLTFCNLLLQNTNEHNTCCDVS